MTLLALGIDKAINSFGYDLGITKSIANSLGAEKITNKVNAKLVGQSEVATNRYAQMLKEMKTMPKIEDDIKKESQARQDKAPKDKPKPSKARSVLQSILDTPSPKKTPEEYKQERRLSPPRKTKVERLSDKIVAIERKRD